MSMLASQGELVLAHQGGWDEILLMVVTAAVVIGWLRWSERRARNRAEQEEDTEQRASQAEGAEERDPSP